MTADKRRLVGDHGPRCQGCMRTLEARLLQVDHRVPLVDGGTDDYPNKQLLCGPCHRIKSAAEATDRAAKSTTRRTTMPAKTTTRPPPRKSPTPRAVPPPPGGGPDRSTPLRLSGGGLLLTVGVLPAVTLPDRWGLLARLAVMSVVVWVAVGGWGVWWQSVRHARRGAAVRLVRVVADATGGKPEDCRVKVRRWQGWRSPEPVDFTAGWSQLFADSDAKAQGRLLEHLAEKTGAAASGMTLTAEWWPAQDSGRFIRSAPQPVEQVSVEPEVHPPSSAETDAETIRGVLAERYKTAEGFRVTITSANASNMTAFRVDYPKGFTDHKDDSRAELQETVHAKLYQRWRPEWHTQRNSVVFTRRPPMPSDVPLPAADVTDRMVLPLGIGESGELVAWNAATHLTAHCLVVGSTGGGKTNLITDLSLAAAARDWGQIVIDGKGTSLVGLRHLPGVEVTGYGEADEMAAAMTYAESMMRRRYAQVRDEEADPLGFRPYLVIVDEAAEFVTNLNRAWKQQRGQGPLHPAVIGWHSMARLAREANMHLVVGLQQGAARFFDGTEARDNYGCRVSLGPLKSAEAARMIYGSSSVGRDLPTSPPGRATADVGGGPEELQTFRAPRVAVSGRVADEDRDVFDAYVGPARAAAERRSAERVAAAEARVAEPDPVPPAQLEAGDAVTDPMGEDPEETFTVAGVVEQGDVWDVTLRDAGGVEVTWGRGADEVFLRAA